MTTTATRQRSETAEQILDLAETLIQTRGYSAFSYQDIADALGIRKASIHSTSRPRPISASPWSTATSIDSMPR